MTRKNKSIEKLVTSLKVKAEKKVNVLDGLNAHTDIVLQFDLDKHPRFIYQAIRAAQNERLKSVNDTFGIYSDNKITLTVNEKNFVYVYEEDVKGGVLRQTGLETLSRISELIEKQNNG